MKFNTHINSVADKAPETLHCAI